MKHRFLIFIVLFAYGIAVYGQDCDKSASIDLKICEYIHYLASDRMMGRPTPSPYLDSAATYVADKFHSFGLKCANDSYFQKIPFVDRDIVLDSTYLVLHNSMGTNSFQIKREFTPLYETGSSAVHGAAIVFAGYGITAPELGYDDYHGVDVKGKIVIVMKKEPAEFDDKSIFDGKKATRYSDISYKVENASAHGASAVLIVTPPLHNLAITAQGYPWRSLYNFKHSTPSYNMVTSKRDISVAVISEAVINQIFVGIDSLKAIQRGIDESLMPNSFGVDDITCDFSTCVREDVKYASNVIGYVEGSDSLFKREYLIIGAHYDHIGTMINHKEDEDFIFNGADDNASGSAAVLTLAELFAKMDVKPKRSVVFILFAGEEKGLLGSEYYCLNPLFQMSKTVAMLNIDMISRNSPDHLDFFGDGKNPDLAKVICTVNENHKFILSRPKYDMYEYSDNYSFYKRGISSMSFCTGLHKDYHRVSDNPDASDCAKAASVTRLIFDVAMDIANSKYYYRKMQ